LEALKYFPYINRYRSLTVMVSTFIFNDYPDVVRTYLNKETSRDEKEIKHEMG